MKHSTNTAFIVLILIILCFVAPLRSNTALDLNQKQNTSPLETTPIALPIPLVSSEDANFTAQMPRADDGNAVPVLNSYDHEPTLNWDVVTWASKYQIQIDDSPNFTSVDFAQKTQNLSVIPDGLPDGVWYWRIRARDKQTKIWGNWSDIGIFQLNTTAK